jgi:hypothetical protein
MKYTKQELIDRINKNDTDFFQNFYNHRQVKRGPENRYEEVWNLNWGDGNDLFVAINFPDENITVYMKGYYSSHDESRIQKVALGVPYQHTETRYRPATLDEIRDMKLNDILN